MDCARVREALLDLPDGSVDPSVRRAVEGHLPTCPDCRRLHDALTRVEQGLSQHLRPPVLGPGFRPHLRARIAEERRHEWADWLPAAVHFVSCGLAAAICVAVLPDQAGLIAAVAAGITIVSHFLLTTAQSALDAAGD